MLAQQYLARPWFEELKPVCEEKLPRAATFNSSVGPDTNGPRWQMGPWRFPIRWTTGGWVPAVDHVPVDPLHRRSEDAAGDAVADPVPAVVQEEAAQ